MDGWLNKENWGLILLLVLPVVLAALAIGAAVFALGWLLAER